MTTAELIVLALGLAADAFSVSVCEGLSMKKSDYPRALLTALLFGAFQGAMPLAGFFLSRSFEEHISRYSHWVAFALLGFIGAKMIFEVLHGRNEQVRRCSGIAELLVLAVATSIDALAAGVVFAAQGMSIVLPVIVIAAVTFVTCLTGAFIGCRFGSRLGSRAQLAGGSVLILIGVKLLLDGIGVL